MDKQSVTPRPNHITKQWLKPKSVKPSSNQYYWLMKYIGKDKADQVCTMHEASRIITKYSGVTLFGKKVSK